MLIGVRAKQREAIMDDLLTPLELAQQLRTTEASLAQLRYRGTGPRFLRPTPRKIFYRRADVEAWLDGSIRTSTAASA